MAQKTVGDLEARAQAADARARTARAEAARLRRAVARFSSERVDERTRMLGRAMLAWCADDERVRAATIRYLRDHLAIDLDRDLLNGTLLDVSAPAAPDGATSGASGQSAS